MGYLNKIVKFHPPTYAGTSHHSAVNSSISTYLHIILYYHIPDLGYLIITTIYRRESKSVSTYPSTGMNYTTVTYLTTMIDFDS